ncbi:MAG: hypothetical protein V4591_09735 [Bdellovibrionota bacterium]
MAFDLPPLRRQVLGQFIKIVFLFACLGFSLLVIIHESDSNPRTLIAQNHKVTNEVINMLEAWDFLKLTTSLKSLNPEVKFQSSLDQVKKYILKVEEEVTVKQIDELWKNQVKKGLSLVNQNDYMKMRLLLIRLITENQVDVAQTLNHQISLSKRIAFLAFIIFLIGLGITIYFSEKLSGSIAQPLKKITEALQSKPKLNQKLKFPVPTSLEIKVLILELNDLWKRLTELNAKNMQSLELQKREMEVIFSAMEDAAVFFDSQNRIQYYNTGFLEILEVKEGKFIFEQKWNDLSLMNDSYLQLRDLLRKDNFDEILYTCVINEEDKIYRARKKIALDAKNNKIGVILLLHDITKKLPTEVFRETLQKLKLQKNER